MSNKTRNRTFPIPFIRIIITFPVEVLSPSCTTRNCVSWTRNCIKNFRVKPSFLEYNQPVGFRLSNPVVTSLFDMSGMFFTEIPRLSLGHWRNKSEEQPVDQELFSCWISFLLRKPPFTIHRIYLWKYTVKNNGEIPFFSDRASSAMWNPHQVFL